VALPVRAPPTHRRGRVGRRHRRCHLSEVRQSCCGAASGCGMPDRRRRIADRHRASRPACR